jgi:hypothetical protein
VRHLPLRGRRYHLVARGSQGKLSIRS